MTNPPKSVFDVAQLIGKALEGLSSEDKQKALHGAAVLSGLVETPRLTSTRIESGSAGAGDAGSDAAGAGRTGGKQKSLVEYLNEKQPATNQQRIAVFAAYREEIEGLDRFSKDDLETYFAKAKLASPGNNFNRDYYKTVTEGWIHDKGSSSYLTQTGQKVVNVGFGGKSKPRGRAALKAKRAPGKTEQ